MVVRPPQRPQGAQARELSIEECFRTEYRAWVATNTSIVDSLERRREVRRKPIRTVEAIVDRLCSSQPAPCITRKQILPIGYLGYLVCWGIGECQPPKKLGRREVIHPRFLVDQVQRHCCIVV